MSLWHVSDVGSYGNMALALAMARPAALAGTREVYLTGPDGGQVQIDSELVLHATQLVGMPAWADRAQEILATYGKDPNDNHVRVC